MARCLLDDEHVAALREHFDDTRAIVDETSGWGHRPDLPMLAALVLRSTPLTAQGGNAKSGKSGNRD